MSWYSGSPVALTPAPVILDEATFWSVNYFNWVTTLGSLFSSQLYCEVRGLQVQ
jgi:hypothetical protein